MVRLLIGVFFASIVLFFFGFLYWGLNPLPYTAWSPPQDEPGAIAALRRHFPERGTYFVPAREASPEATEEKFKHGPLAFVLILSAKGRPVVEPRIMIKGYLLSLVGLLLIAYQLRMVRTSLPTFASRVFFSSLSGLIASVMILLGDVVWWEMPEDWKLWQALYHIIAWTLAGGVLAFFIDSPKQVERISGPLTEELPAVAS